MTSKTFTRFFTIFAIGVLAAVVTGIGIIFYWNYQHLQGKAEWAAFQGAHSTFKSIPLQHPEIRDWQGEKYLVCPNPGENVVIMLNPKHSPFYKQWPYTSSFVLTAQDYRAAMHAISPQDYLISDTVSEVLRSKTAKADAPATADQRPDNEGVQ